MVDNNNKVRDSRNKITKVLSDSGSKIEKNNISQFKSKDNLISYNDSLYTEEMDFNVY
jgi:hypothetical protein